MTTGSFVKQHQRQFETLLGLTLTLFLLLDQTKTLLSSGISSHSNLNHRRKWLLPGSYCTKKCVLFFDEAIPHNESQDDHRL